MPNDFSGPRKLQVSGSRRDRKIARRSRPELAAYSRDIDAVVETIRPRGSGRKSRREIKGDTFVVPELLARNEDHPFNYYVPPHYDPTKPMGLILWMHGGGTYKPGKNVNRRSVEGKLEELEMPATTSSSPPRHATV